MARTKFVMTSLFVLVLCGATARSHEREKRQSVNVQNPPVWQALDLLRGGGEPLNAAQVQQVMASAVPGQSYPTLAYIPQTSFTCSSARQPGFYADPETGCQVFRRCEQNNYMFSYICPNSTLFNQITLVCDYWYNVQCDRSQQFVDYSNPRIYIQGVPLLDDVNNGYGGASGNLIGGGGGGGAGNYAGGGGGGNYAGGGGGGNYAGGGGGGNYASGSLGGGQAVTIGGGGGTYGGGGGQYESGRLQGQGGRGSSSLQGLSGGSLYSGGSSGSQGGDYSRVQSGAYNTMLGTSSYSSGGQPQQQQQPQQQLPYGTLLSSSYGPSPQSQYQSPSSGSQGGYAQQSYQQPQPQFQPASGYSSQYSSQQQRSPYSSGVIQQIGPSYRSLSNRLLRLQADASDIIPKTVTESTPSSTSVVVKSFEQSG